MGTRVILSNVLAFHALTGFSLILVFLVRDADSKKPLYQLVVNAFAMFYAHDGEVELFGTGHDLDGILVCNAPQCRSDSSDLLPAS